MQFYHLLLIIIFIVFFEALAISCIKKYHNNDGIIFFVVAVLFYAVICYLLSLSFDYNDSMGINNVIWSALSVITIIIIGIVFFKEQFKTSDAVACGFIIAGLIIFRFNMKK